MADDNKSDFDAPDFNDGTSIDSIKSDNNQVVGSRLLKFLEIITASFRSLNSRTKILIGTGILTSTLAALALVAQVTDFKLSSAIDSEERRALQLEIQTATREMQTNCAAKEAIGTGIRVAERAKALGRKSLQADAVLLQFQGHAWLSEIGTSASIAKDNAKLFQNLSDKDWKEIMTGGKYNADMLQHIKPERFGEKTPIGVTVLNPFLSESNEIDLKYASIAMSSADGARKTYLQGTGLTYSFEQAKAKGLLEGFTPDAVRIALKSPKLCRAEKSALALRYGSLMTKSENNSESIEPIEFFLLAKEFAVGDALLAEASMRIAYEAIGKREYDKVYEHLDAELANSTHFSKHNLFIANYMLATAKGERFERCADSFDKAMDHAEDNLIRSYSTQLGRAYQMCKSWSSEPEETNEFYDRLISLVKEDENKVNTLQNGRCYSLQRRSAKPFLDVKVCADTLEASIDKLSYRQVETVLSFFDKSEDHKSLLETSGNYLQNNDLKPYQRAYIHGLRGATMRDLEDFQGAGAEFRLALPYYLDKGDSDNGWLLTIFSGIAAAEVDKGNFSGALDYARKAYQKVSTETAWKRADRAARPYILSLLGLSLAQETDRVIADHIELCEVVCNYNEKQENINELILMLFAHRFETGSSADLEMYLSKFERGSLTEYGLRSASLLRASIDYIEGRTEVAERSALNLFRKYPNEIADDPLHRIFVHNLVSISNLSLDEEMMLSSWCQDDGIFVERLTPLEQRALCLLLTGQDFSSDDISNFKEGIRKIRASPEISFAMNGEILSCLVNAIEKPNDAPDVFAQRMEACLLHQRQNFLRYGLDGSASRMGRIANDIRADRGLPPIE